MTPDIRETICLNILKHVNDKNECTSFDPWTYLHEDTVLLVMGNTFLSGTYFGRQQIEGVFVSNIRDYIEHISFEHVETFASENSVAMLLRPVGMSNKGAPLNSSNTIMGLVTDFLEAKIESLRLYADTKEIETTILGRKYVPRTRNEEQSV